MTNKTFAMSSDWDAGTKTNSGPVDNRLFFGGLGCGFTNSTELSLSAGSLARYFSNGVVFTDVSGTPMITVKAASMQDATWTASEKIAENLGGVPRQSAIMWRKQNDSNFMFGFIFPNTGYLQEMVGGVNNVLASGAHVQHAEGAAVTMHCKATGNDHEFGERSPDIFTLTATTVNNAGAGAWGVASNNIFYSLVCHGMREIATATTGKWRSATFDAGSITEKGDVLNVGGVSLNGGSGVVRVSAVNSGSPNFSQTITLADGTHEYLFTALTGRYWQVEASLPSGGSLAWLGFSKGNDAGGGGSTTVMFGGQSGYYG